MDRTKTLALLGLFAIVSLVPAQPLLEADALPPGAERRLGTNRLRLPTAIESLAFSPAGETLVVGSAGNVHFWDAKTFRESSRLEAGVFAYAPSGRFLIRSVGETLEIRDLHKNVVLKTRSYRHWEGGSAFDLQFTANENLVWVGVTHSGFYLYDWVNDRIVVHVKKPLAGNVRLVAAHDRRSFSMARHDISGLDVIDGLTGRLISHFHTVNRPLWRSLSHNGKQMAFGPKFQVGDVGCARWFLLPMTEAEFAEKYEAFHYTDRKGDRPAAIEGIFDAKGEFLFLSGAKLHVFDLAKQDVIATVTRHNSTPTAFAISNDNKVLAVGYQDGTVELRNSRTLQPLVNDPHPHGSALAVAFARGGDKIATLHVGEIRLWNRRDGALLKKLAVPDAKVALPLAFIDGDRRLLLGNEFEWDTATGRCNELPDANPEAYRQMAAIAADGKRRLLKSGSREVNRIELIDSGRSVVNFPIEAPPPTSLSNFLFFAALSADGGRVAMNKNYMRHRATRWAAEMVSISNDVEVYDVSSGRSTLLFETQRMHIPSAIDLSRDGRFLALAERREKTRGYQLWHLTTGASLWKVNEKATQRGRNWEYFYGFEMGDTSLLTFSPDGQFLADVADNTIIVREALSGLPVMKFAAQSGDVTALAFAPDSRTLAAAESGSAVILWKIPPFAAAKADPWDRAEFELLWANLRGVAPCAFQAMADLHGGGDEVVELLKERMFADRDAERQRVSRAFSELASDHFPTREKASADLARFGCRVKPQLAEAIAQCSDLEQKRRLVAIHEHIKDTGISADELRLCRAIYLLERIGTPAARALVDSMARSGEFDLPAETARAAAARRSKVR